MFSLSSIFGGKRQQEHHGSSPAVAADPEPGEPALDDYVLVERRHSAHEPRPALPALPSLPYSLAPSFGRPAPSPHPPQPNASPPDRTDMLSGVPFVLSTKLDAGNSQRHVESLLTRGRNILSTPAFIDASAVDFRLEKQVLREQ